MSGLLPSPSPQSTTGDAQSSGHLRERLLRAGHHRQSFPFTFCRVGSPKIRWTLLAQGQRVGRHRVARLMRALGLRGRPYPRKKPRTQAGGTEPSAKNLLNQDFQAPAPPSTLGFGYHLYPHGGRLALPGGHHGPLLPEDCRLVTGSTAHHFPGHPGV